MKRSRKKRSKKTEKIRNKSEALKKDMVTTEDENLPYDDEATRELDMVLILSEAVILNQGGRPMGAIMMILWRNKV